MRQLLLRPIIFVTLLMGLLVVGELIALTRLSWLNKQRIHTIENDIGKGHRLQQSIFQLLQLQSRLALHQNDPSVTAEQIDELQNQLLDLIQSHNQDEFSVPVDLPGLQDKFSQAIAGDSQALTDTVNLIQSVLDQQTAEEEKLLANIEDDSRLELELAIMLPILLLWIGHYFFRNNVLDPLDALRDLLSGLAEGVKKPIDRSSSDPIVSDLFQRYNDLVAHLVELEQVHLTYTCRLESQVRQTGHELLEQSQRLAKAERLAAVAEMAASTAHELRNPLAIIQLALENMQSETDDPELQERLALLHKEAIRLTTHLNDLLGHARRHGEAAQPLNVGQAARELVKLLSFQAADCISFELDSPQDVIAVLPEVEFRQALVNLLQNAVQAIGNREGRILISIRQIDNHLQLTVRDSGGGFQPAFLQQGIRPFVSLKEQGSGLGLVMVQRFARDQHGQLKLSNDPPGQACVTLTLPLTPL